MSTKELDWHTTSLDARGILRVIEHFRLPFEPKRQFYVSDVPTNSVRGAHAHIKCHQILFILNGGITCRIIDSAGERQQDLSNTSGFLHLPPMTWAEQFNFAPGTVMGCLASEPYDEEDYINDFEEFQRLLF